MAASGRFGRWLGAFRSEDYPRWTLVCLVVFAVVSSFMTWVVLVDLPRERAIANHGATATAHAQTYITHEYVGHTRSIRYHANLAWFDTSGHPRRFDDLWIGKNAYDHVAADHGDATIRYDTADPGARPIIVSDIGHRELEQDYAMAAFAGSVLAFVFGLFYFRRRLRAWRAHQSELANPQKPWWFGGADRS